MGIKRRVQKVKGTARPSGGEKKLIKQLYVADKNRQQEKMRKNRILLKMEKEATRHGPNHRSHAAFFSFLKRRAHYMPKPFEMKDEDEPLTIATTLQDEWSSLAARQEDLDADCIDVKCLVSLARRTSSKAHSLASLILARRTALSGTKDHLPLLHSRKNTRVQFYHRKRRAWHARMMDTNTVCVPEVPWFREGEEDVIQDVQDIGSMGREEDATTMVAPLDIDTDGAADDAPMVPSMDGQRERRDKVQQLLNCCEVVSCQEIERHDQLWMRCHLCLEPVSTRDMVVLSWVPDSLGTSFAYECAIVHNSNWGTKQGDGANVATSNIMTCTSGEGQKSARAQVAHPHCAIKQEEQDRAKLMDDKRYRVA